MDDWLPEKDPDAGKLEDYKGEGMLLNTFKPTGMGGIVDLVKYLFLMMEKICPMPITEPGDITIQKLQSEPPIILDLVEYAHIK